MAPLFTNKETELQLKIFSKKDAALKPSSLPAEAKMASGKVSRNRGFPGPLGTLSGGLGNEG